MGVINSVLLSEPEKSSRVHVLIGGNRRGGLGIFFSSHNSPLEIDPINLYRNCGLTQCDFQAVSSSDPKPEGVSCVGNTPSLTPESGVEGPVGKPAEGSFEPLHSTGVKM